MENVDMVSLHQLFFPNVGKLVQVFKSGYTNRDEKPELVGILHRYVVSNDEIDFYPFALYVKTTDGMTHPVALDHAIRKIASTAEDLGIYFADGHSIIIKRLS